MLVLVQIALCIFSWNIIPKELLLIIYVKEQTFLYCQLIYIFMVKKVYKW